MSSHVLYPEVERVCDRVALLRGGELVLTSLVEDACKLAPRACVSTSTRMSIQHPAFHRDITL